MMEIEMGPMDGGEDNYPEFYEETDKKPGFKVGDEVPAVIRIKSIKETDRDGKTSFGYEACVISIEGKTTEEAPEEELDDDAAIDKGLDEAYSQTKDEGK